MKLLYPYLKKNRYKILAGLVAMILVDLAQLAVPQIIKQVIDTINVGGLDRQTLFMQCMLIIGLGLFMAVLRYFWRTLLMGSARDVEKGIRDDLFSHILNLDAPYYDKTKTGDIMAHATSDINHVRMAFSFGLIALVDTVLLGGSAIAIMMWTSPKLTAFALIPMPFLVIVIKILGGKMHLLHKTAQESFSQLTELVRENFFGIRIIKVFNFESLVGDTVKTASTDYFSKNLKRAIVSAFLKPMMGLFFNLSTLIVLFYGGYLTMNQMISPGDLVAFLQYLGILAWPIIAIGWMTNLFQRGLASLKRINNLLDAVPDVKSVHNPVCVSLQNNDIRLNNIQFSYDELSPILSDITLEIPNGSRIGITGPPGSGKTSLIQLIPRLYNLDSGTIYSGEHDIARMDLNHLRGQIALMPQESFLFSGTIKENILLGQDIEKNILDQVIDASCLKQTLEKMPEGIHTVVGERGITLSGGQKQRIALARTLILDRPVIILDDPISQVDTHTASEIISKFNQMNIKKTVIIVSHRISALSGCDKIFVLNKGRIDQSGTHEDLIRTSAFYKKAYHVQQFEEEDHA